MKLKLMYLFPLLATLAAGCGGTKKNAPQPIPDGNYTGQFRLIHVHSDTRTKDTLKTNLQISMSQSLAFKVTGDTSTLHAGSYGTFTANGDYGSINFDDKTYPTTGTPTKTHLNGSYQFLINGDKLEMEAFGALDTLVLQYDLQRVN